MKILAINAEIGLGHPNYLDYVLQVIKQMHPRVEIVTRDVLNEEKGLKKMFWQASKGIYSLGAKGGLITDLYNKFRSASKTPRISVCSITSKDYDKILVAHPILATSFDCAWYIHGEIAAPKECVLENVKKIVVPIDYTAKRLIAQGVKPEQILVSGLIIALDLLAGAKENYQKRVARIKSDKPLTIGFFISGAYPPAHIKKVIEGIISASKENQRIIVFLGTNADKAKDFLRTLDNKKKRENKSESAILFVQGRTRSDYQKRVNKLLPLLDVFVAPSHEHTNWAVGLGLPMFALFPMIGSYAAENYRFAYEQGVSYPIQTIIDAQSLDKIIFQLRDSGELIKMGERGFDKFPIDGAIKTAQVLLGK
jgi:hypothetical protein